MEQSCKTKNKIAIIGAGPSGIYCAINIILEFNNYNYSDYFIDIYDKSEPLNTLLPTGGGRCNITNAQSDLRTFISNYPRGEKFLYSIFSRHSNSDTINFFNSIGINTYIEDDLRIFPKSNSAKDVKNKLLNYLNKFNKTNFINKKINSISQLKNYDAIIISTGSKTSENILKSIKQPYFEFRPSLCSLKIKNNIYPKGVSVKSLDGDFIFTNQGISGPFVYKISAQNALKEFPYQIKIRLFEYSKLKELVDKYPKKSIGNLVSSFIPKSLARVIVKDFSKNACEISKKDLESLCSIEFCAIGHLKGEEIVNCGGVDLDSIDKNCKSKIKNNIWFCGEILNIDGYCGGFNLQNCWSGGYIVALDVVKFILNKKGIKYV